MKKFDLGIAIYLTASKFLAYVIFVVGSVFSFINHNPEVFMFSAGIAAGLHGLKSWQQSTVEKTKINNGVVTQDENRLEQSAQVPDPTQVPQPPQPSQPVKRVQKNKQEIG